MTVELLNNLFLSRPIQPVTSQEQKSPNLLRFECDWKHYIEGLQAERWSYRRKKKTLQDFASEKRQKPLEMPPFDFGEEGE